MLRRLTVEALAKDFRLPEEADLSPFIGAGLQDELVDANEANALAAFAAASTNGEPSVVDLEDYYVAAPVGPPQCPTVKPRRRRRKKPNGGSCALDVCSVA